MPLTELNQFAIAQERTRFNLFVDKPIARIGAQR